MKKTILCIFILFVLFILVFIPWFRSLFTKEIVEVAKKDEFIELLGGAKLEFMGGFTEQAYDAGGNSGPNSHTFTYYECDIAVYEITDQVASYIEKTNGEKEISKYFLILKNEYLKKIIKNEDIVRMKNSILYLNRYKINNIYEIIYSNNRNGIRYFDKRSIINLWDENYYKKYTSSFIIPDLQFEKKIKCLFDHSNYYGIGYEFERRGGFWKYIDDKFDRKYPYYFSFNDLNSYEKMINESTGFYIVVPDSSVIYVFQPEYKKIFKLY